MTVLWIRIGTDLHHFAESGSGSASKHADPLGDGQSGSVPVRYQFQANEKVCKVVFFQENFNIYVVQNTENKSYI
jgi:hypothetical protein